MFVMKITFIIGGARSGKSLFALREASRINGPKAYIATAEALDEEMKERIEKHKVERGSDWDTYEEPINAINVLSEIKDRYSAAVLDCLTIWLSNILLRTQMPEHRDKTVDECIQKLVDGLRSLNSSHSLNLFIVSNEVGMGIVPEHKLGRQFRDLAGMLNQKVAEIADEVYLVTAGIPIKIKDQK